MLIYLQRPFVVFFVTSLRTDRLPNNLSAETTSTHTLTPLLQWHYFPTDFSEQSAQTRSAHDGTTSFYRDPLAKVVSARLKTLARTRRDERTTQTDRSTVHKYTHTHSTHASRSLEARAWDSRTRDRRRDARTRQLTLIERAYARRFVIWWTFSVHVFRIRIVFPCRMCADLCFLRAKTW